MSDRYGNHLRRWSLDPATGEIGCHHDAVDVRAMSPADVAAIEAHNALMHAAADALASYQAALAVVEPEEPHTRPVLDEAGEEVGTEPTPAYAAWEAAQATIAGTPAAVVELYQWRQGDLQARDAAVEAFGNAPAVVVPTREEVERATLPALSPRQIRLVMLALGLSDEDVEGQISEIPDDYDRAAALIEWRHATEYRRLHPLVVQLLASMGFPADQADDLWRWAAAI